MPDDMTDALASRSRFARFAHLGLQYCFHERERRNLVLQTGQSRNSAGFLGTPRLWLRLRQVLVRLQRKPFMGGFVCNLAKTFRDLPGYAPVTSNKVIEVRLGNT